MHHPEHHGYQPDVSQNPDTRNQSDTSPHQAAAPLRRPPERPPQIEIASPAEHQENRPAEPKPEHPHRGDEDLTPAEREEKEKARQEAAAALATVYESLKAIERPSAAQVSAAINAAPPLNELRPIFRQQLETVIRSEHLTEKGQEEFVGRGLAAIDLWIHIQGLKRGSNRDLESLRSNLRQDA